MSLKVFLALIISGTIISWLTWGVILFYFNPDQASFWGFGLFYLSLFLALSGSIFLLGDWLAAKIFKNQLMIYRLKSSIRHSLLFVILILGWAFLKSHDLLRWWNLALLILILAVLEFFFISSQKKVIHER